MLSALLGWTSTYVQISIKRCEVDHGVVPFMKGLFHHIVKEALYYFLR
jgi:hypothetical protein